MHVTQNGCQIKPLQDRTCNFFIKNKMFDNFFVYGGLIINTAVKPWDGKEVLFLENWEKIVYC